MPALKTDPWDSVPVTNTFRQQCRHLLGSFFRSLEHSGPWWVSIANPVNGIEQSSLSYLLGFEYNIGVDFLCMIGLAKRGHSRNPLSATVVTTEWEKFIEEEQLSNIMENVNKTKVARTAYYFINYGKKENLFHRPIDQFNGVISKPRKGTSNLKVYQRSFHKKLSDVALGFRNAEQGETKMTGHLKTSYHHLIQKLR